MNKRDYSVNQLFYIIIYNNVVNYILRNINKILLPVLPKRIKIAPAGIISLKNSSGDKIKIKTNQTNYLTYLVYWEGGHLNFEYSRIFVELIKRVGTFYDIGANIGYYSLLAASENKDIRVVGFEPANGPFHFLKENVALNNFQNITIENIALSDKSGIIDFFEIANSKYKYLKYNLAGESNMGNKFAGRSFIVTSVKALTLDEYVQRNNEACIDLIKIDTEGTENLILGNAIRVLQQMKPIVICETLFNTIENELEAIFLDLGYEFFNHNGSGLVKVNSIIRTEDNGVRNCFFVHPGKYHLIEEFVINK
jgi:FkbM family methyltransferase